jgi:hypothetical protein
VRRRGGEEPTEEVEATANGTPGTGPGLQTVKPQEEPSPVRLRPGILYICFGRVCEFTLTSLCQNAGDEPSSELYFHPPPPHHLGLSTKALQIQTPELKRALTREHISTDVIRTLT